ncbi:MAG TPA: hypothetical protein VM840_00985 [Actinomycetota bacterium]|nr:hypothetical protein [Actinomycetota bacterium]
MERYPFGDSRIRSDAIIAFLVGTAVAFFLQYFVFRIAVGRIFITLVVAGVGGLYYHWRRIL